MKMRWVLRLNVFLLDRKLVLNMSKSSYKGAYFGENSWFLAMIFFTCWASTRKAKWCKMHFLFLRLNKKWGARMEKMGQIACFGPLFLLEWCGNKMVFCKD